MKKFSLGLVLTTSLFAIYSCGPRGFATKNAEDCTAWCASQDGQSGSFDAASSICTCSQIAAPPPAQ